MIQQYLLKASVNRFQELVWSSKHLLQPVSAVGGTWVIRQLLKKRTHCSIHCNRHCNKHCRKGRNVGKGRHLADAMRLEGCRTIRTWFYLGFSKVFWEPPADNKHCRKGRNGGKGRHLADAMLLEGCRIIRSWLYLGFSKVFWEPPADDSAVFAEGIR